MKRPIYCWVLIFSYYLLKVKKVLWFMVFSTCLKSLLIAIYCLMLFAYHIQVGYLRSALVCGLQHVWNPFWSPNFVLCFFAYYIAAKSSMLVCICTYEKSKISYIQLEIAASYNTPLFFNLGSNPIHWGCWSYIIKC